MKASLCLGLCFLFSVCFAQGPDLKNLKFTSKKIESGSGLAILFQPPAEHHFNLEAPSKVSRSVDAATENAELSRALSEFKASWKTTSDKCQISAQLYLCDNKNTYCVPVKQSFACEALTGTAQSGVIQKASIEKTEPATEKSWENLFILNDSAKAYELAKQQKKLVMTDFFGIWCPPCNMLDATVFSNKEFKKFAKDYIFLKLDADDPVSFEQKSKYNIKGYPTILITNSEGEEISRIIGSRSPASFFASLRQAVELKSKSFELRKALADTGKNSKAALELAELMMNQEDYLGAQKYFRLGLKAGSLTEIQKQLMMDVEIKLMSEASQNPTSQKNFATSLENALSIYPVGEISMGWTELLQKLGEDLKDESLSNRAQNARLKNAQTLLQNPQLLKNSELTEADLYSVLADIYENLKDEKKSKEFYQQAADAYEKQMKAYGLNLETDRGFNLERIYCLRKAGHLEEAMALYSKLESTYPTEFTFFYAHASALKEDKKMEEALPLAQKAYEFSYGDNRLRATYLLADLTFQKSSKKEALALIDKTLSDYPKTDSLRVRSGRYLDKLKQLRERIQKS